MFVVLLLVTTSLSAQNFGFDDDVAEVVSAAGGVVVSGEVSAELLGYVEDFSDGVEATRLGDVFSGKLNFKAESGHAEAVVNLKLSAPVTGVADAAAPVAIDEGYLTAYFGAVDIEAGLRKLTWGKADSLGPLDVVNPLDYSDLSGISDMMNLKIARPLVHASLRLGQYSKVEGVFVPSFEPPHFSETGRWMPRQLAALSQLPPENIARADTGTLDYAQAGLRFSTSIGGAADVAVQYYYGRLTTPAVTQTMPTSPPPLPPPSETTSPSPATSPPTPRPSPSAATSPSVAPSAPAPTPPSSR
jgi:hypothetical protein